MPAFLLCIPNVPLLLYGREKFYGERTVWDESEVMKEHARCMQVIHSSLLQIRSVLLARAGRHANFLRQRGDLTSVPRLPTKESTVPAWPKVVFFIFLNIFPCSFPDLDHFDADADPFFDVDQDSDLYHAFNPKINLSSYDNLSWHTGTRMRECLFEK